MNVVYAKSSASVRLSNGMVVGTKVGEVWDAGDPMVTEHPELFSTTPVIARNSGVGYVEVEQATAAPGEKRNTRRS